MAQASASGEGLRLLPFMAEGEVELEGTEVTRGERKQERWGREALFKTTSS